MKKMLSCSRIFFPVLFIFLSACTIDQRSHYGVENELLSDSSFCKLANQYAVFNGTPVQNELYTWTSKEQIAQLRNSKTLLIKSRSEKSGKANYDLVLEQKKAAGDSTATFLLSECFAKKRFAWPHPWATVRGYPGENYGDQLLKITFKEDAIFGSFVNNEDTNPVFHFYNMRGKELGVDYVKLHPEKLAVVYFVNARKTTKKSPKYRGTYGPRHSYIKTITTDFPYREYVICNEGMIKEWSYGTAAIIHKMKSELVYLKTTDRLLSGPHPLWVVHSGYLPPYISDDWISNFREDCDYYYTVALVNKYYDLNTKQLEITMNTMNAAIAAQGDSLIVKNK
ncbi:MAG: hypothetical protein JWP12_893 [Bacteroidetes bacterium]|nr:hypothetical protein [Bacteroidota bacterium]